MARQGDVEREAGRYGAKGSRIAKPSLDNMGPGTDREIPVGAPIWQERPKARSTQGLGGQKPKYKGGGAAQAGLSGREAEPEPRAGAWLGITCPDRPWRKLRDHAPPPPHAVPATCRLGRHHPISGQSCDHRGCRLRAGVTPRAARRRAERGGSERPADPRYAAQPRRSRSRASEPVRWRLRARSRPRRTSWPPTRSGAPAPIPSTICRARDRAATGGTHRD